MAQINPAAYPTRYKISVLDSPAEENISIEFSDDLATLLYNGNLTMEDNMDGSNSYCGFDPTQHDYWVGGSIYSSIIADPNNIVNGRIQFNSRPVQNNKQNLRWFLRLSSSSGNASPYTLRWTPQVDGASRTPLYNRSATMSMISQMTNDNVNVTNGSTLLYDYYPVTNINLDKIAIRPTFTVIRYAPTYTDDVITSISISGGTNHYYWEQIKPEDKTPAGVNYNEGLWTNGFYDVMDENDQTKIKYRYILNACTAQTYYGTKAPGASGSVLMGLRVDQSNWDADGDRQLPTTGFSTVYGTLVPYSEGYFDINGVTGVMLNGISGIRFSNTVGSYSNKDRVHFDVNYNDDLYFQNVSYQGTTMASNGGLGTITLRNNSDYRAESFVQMSYGLGGIFAADEAPNYTQTHYTFHSNGAITQSLHNSSTRSLVYLTDAPYSLQSLWAALASLGVYVAGYNAIPSTLIIGTDFPSTLYHGEVLEDGTTTGVMIQGDDIEDLPTWDVIDYTPVIPTPTPPGPPEGEESGDRIPNNERYFSGAYNFITQYAMTRQQLGQFGNLLWTSWADQQGITDMWKNFKMFISADPASDTGSIDIASIMDFILSLQVFPFDLSSLLHTDSTNVCIGTGQYPLAVSGKKLLTINHILDCGTMAIPRPYNDFRDYENMTITAYLPYCGSVELNPGDVIGRSVSIDYSVDTLSGSCTAVLTAHDDDGYLYNVGMINGQISASIPMTATNSGQIRAQRISDVASLAGLVGNTYLGNISQGAQVASGAESNPIGAISNAIYGTVGRSFNAGLSAQQMFANRFSRGAISCPTLAGGNGIAAFFQPACPYIQMRYGLYQKPANYDHSVGEVSASSNPLSAYAGSGFTVCENVDISGFTCHEEERSEIKALLESGVYL